MENVKTRPLRMLFAAVMAVVAVAACCLTVAPQQAYAAATVSTKISGTVDYDEANAFLAKLNKLRANKGLKALVMDKSLMKAAEQRAAELSVAYSHKRPNGTMCFTASGKMNGENIADYPDASSVYTGWKNSPPHYKNMTRSSFKSVGICCFYRDGATWWVNVFGNGKASAYSKRSGQKNKTFTVKIAKKYLTKSALSINPYSIDTDSKQKAVIYYYPSYAEAAGTLPNSMFTFKSSKPNKLSVNKKGVLTSHGTGKAKITITAKAKKSCKYTQTITIEDSWYNILEPDD